MKRRDFVRNTGLGLLSASFLTSEAVAELAKKKTLLSLQLYSIRDHMKTDPVGTIKALSKIGYKDCEHAGYNDQKRQFYGHSPEEWKKILADNGMTMQSGHSVFGKQHWNFDKKELADVWKTTVEDSVKAGQKYIISPWLDVSLRKNFDDLKQFMDAFNVCGEYCKKQGIRYGYHNHDFEFSLKLTSKRVYDIILENTDPKLVAQQLDIGNMYGGGGRAMELLKQYPGRFELLHVKDEVDNGKGGHESGILGTGIIGVQEILKTSVNAGPTFYLIIEQESYQGKDPVACMKENYDVMKKWGYA
ncbi:TIM barrel protein [Emticicia sp. CRIBPO]|uniref:sugar phosphate isomerase/epimerase family protein n=1 Tax=Emticicia sp. CRIBPO TaxID=2683258 RepID=UPI0014134BBD|nr:sugar phosphate isomerase/epimerase [Emticicia sp. CRIBPO]NBA84482.1 TIM barrel protein [Emticicia sp. CRIBPO]